MIHIIKRLFHIRPSASINGTDRLYHAVALLARKPAFYQAPYHVPDTLDGRFDLLATLVGLVCLRLSQLPEGEGQKASQALFDMMFHQFELNLREGGIGDLSVPKQMRRLIQSFYGRMANYAELLDRAPAEAPLAEALGRNIHGGQDNAGAVALARWILQVWQPLLQNFNSVSNINILTGQVQALSEDLTGDRSDYNDRTAA